MKPHGTYRKHAAHRQHRRWYVVAVLVTVFGIVLYLQWRDLGERRQQYRRSVLTVQEVEKRVAELEHSLTEMERRVEDLRSADSLETEASIRRIQQWVREGETVYRLEPLNKEAASAAPAQPE